MAYEGEFRPGMVFEYEHGVRITLDRRHSLGYWVLKEGGGLSDHYLREHARLVSAPPVEESIEWARFVPTGPLPKSDWLAIRNLPDGSVIASWSHDCGGGSVRRYRDGDSYDGDLLAGYAEWKSGCARLIRHADGRWAEGYGPDGPVAKPAARPLAEGWERLKDDTMLRCDGLGFPVPRHEGRKAIYGLRLNGDDCFIYETCACEACAERAGVFADVAVAAPAPVAPPKPTPAPPSCNWTCSPEHGTHGPRCGNQPLKFSADAIDWGLGRAPGIRVVGDYRPGASKANTHRAEYLAWAAAQHGLLPEPRPPAPRIRDCYVEGDGADPDYVSGQGVRS